jgi:hypothetical protein
MSSFVFFDDVRYISITVPRRVPSDCLSFLPARGGRYVAC